MEFLKLWILKLTLTIQYEKMAMPSLISDVKSQFPEAKELKERWKLGLSDEEMVDIAQHHLKLPNFRGVIPKDQHENDLHVIHFMEHNLCVNNK